MSNNTINHVSDKSIYVTFDPTGTDWPDTITNVQDALEKIGSWARTDTGLPIATTSVRGIAQIATEADIDAGTDNNKIVTPKLLAYRMQNPKASQTVWGYTKYSTDAESTTVTNDASSITPRSLNYVFNNRKGTESVWGSSKIATTAQAVAGTDNTVTMTPLKVKQAIASLVPVQSSATESSQGLVQLATVAQVQAGTIREGYAISPYTFIRLTATESNLGVIRIASQAEANAGTDDTKAITAKKLINTRATGSQFGVVKLATTVGYVANTALSSNAYVLPSDRSAVINGSLYENSAIYNNKYQTWTDLDWHFPVGAIVMTGFQTDHGSLYICDGRSLNKNDYPLLFERIGYTFGGGGDWFNIPDCRGVAVRGHDRGRGLNPNRGYGTYEGDMLGWHEHPLQLIYQNGGNIPKWQAVYELKSAEKNDQSARVFDASITKATGVGGEETRMKNIALNYVIRTQ